MLTAATKLFFLLPHPSPRTSLLSVNHRLLRPLCFHSTTTTTTSSSSFHFHGNGRRLKRKKGLVRRRRCISSQKDQGSFLKKKPEEAAAEEVVARARSRALSRVKRRTRSDLGLDLRQWEEYVPVPVDGDGGLDVADDGKGTGVGLHEVQAHAHVPVMLGEVLQVFCRPQIRSFVDCTLGAAGHSCAMIRSHPEMRLLVGLDIDPEALALARSRLDQLVDEPSFSDLKVHTHLRNFKYIKSVVGGVAENLLIDGVDGILMDLGMSSMQVNSSERGFSILGDGPLDMRMNPQASLKAEDILNSWPESEVGRILHEYGEESNWRLLQRKIINARAMGGLHSTVELVDLVQSVSPRSAGRHGWIKTAIRVFQALRIAVNDELKTLEDALYACFDCLSSGGRLSVISFHSLEDRIVKHTFLNIAGNKDEGSGNDMIKGKVEDAYGEEIWSKGKIVGRNGIILTKRPITPSEEEEKMNQRCRSAKLRVIQKL